MTHGTSAVYEFFPWARRVGTLLNCQFNWWTLLFDDAAPLFGILTEHLALACWRLVQIGVEPVASGAGTSK